ncbi:MAG: hypothetical protein E7Z89_08465 [Cyanobacteria bacterium SIG28]|nr:hypothetical protein [Cyanobacteria bacterium SIG28]
MNSPNFISSIDDCYKALVVKDYWEQPSTDTCKKIVKYLNEYLQNNPNDARAYYLRSMAKFHLMDLIPPDYFWHTDSEYAKGKTWNKDEAWEDYNTAIGIDPDIVKKNPDVRIICVGHSTGLKYYFRKPCLDEEFNKIMKNSPNNDYFVFWGFLIIVVCIGKIMSLFDNIPDIYYAPIAIFLILGVFYVIIKLICTKIKDPITKLHRKCCEKVVSATYNEWHG